jgi:predicted 3-demethylubiquinone-9 3-methyltransferase (glyoxalase superfamily)
MRKISPFLWYDNNAAEAAIFYVSVFDDSAIIVSSPMLTAFKLAGHEFTALNGGPKYKLNPAISLFVKCDTETEADNLWQKLSDGGKVMMPLNKYPWSDKYGWCADKYGLSWQIIIGKYEDVQQKIIPSMLFVGQQYGNGEAAVKFYNGIFPNASIDNLSLYGPGMPQPEGKLMHAQFTLGGTTFVAMDGFGNHEFAFNEAFSFVINCSNQDEVDFYWHKLTADGGSESQCAWLKDKFGISWQVVPQRLMELMSDKDAAKANRVMQAMMQMKKIIIADLEKAAEG